MRALTVNAETMETSIIDLPREGALAQMQEAVGGYIECVSLEGFDMWVNEDFISLELPLNDVATVCQSMMVGPENAYICGDVVFTGPTDKRGFTRGLYAEEAAEILQELIMLEEMITKSRLHHAREARESGAHVGKHPV